MNRQGFLQRGRPTADSAYSGQILRRSHERGKAAIDPAKGQMYGPWSNMFDRRSTKDRVADEMPSVQREAASLAGQGQNPVAQSFSDASFGRDYSLVPANSRVTIEQSALSALCPGTIVDGFLEDVEPKRLTAPEVEETRPSEEPAALVGVNTSQEPAVSDFNKSTSRSKNASIQPLSWAELQRLPKNRGVQISGPPVGKSLADISAGGGAGAAGYTDWPTGYVAPDFEFNASKTGPQWSAKPTLKTAASEGASGSFFTSAGKHKTSNQEGGKDVYWNFSAAISGLVEQGEQEHCDDFAEAYNISLKEAETIINTNLVGKTFVAGTKADAEKLVLDEITSKLTHVALGNDKTKWAATYNTLFTKTLTRDTSGWHTISKGARSIDAAGNVVYEIVKGTSQIGSHASNTVIKY